MTGHKSNNIFMTAIKIGLIAYTMIRTIDLVMSTLPDSIKIFGVVAVCGLDLALLGWDNYTADPHKAKSDRQHTVGASMLVINLLGIGAAMVADSMRVVNPIENETTISAISIWFISAVILSNIAALIAVNQLDPDREEIHAQAEHQRKIDKIKADADRAMEEDRRITETGVSRYKNKRELDAARKRYFLDEDGNGIPDEADELIKSGESLDAMIAKFESGLEALRKTQAKSNNGHRIMASEGEEASPKSRRM